MTAHQPWPPATVQTPVGEEPFEQAIGWYTPLMLRWIAHNPTAQRVPSGKFVSQVLGDTATRWEREVQCRRAAEDEVIRLKRIVWYKRRLLAVNQVLIFALVLLIWFA